MFLCKINIFYLILFLINLLGLGFYAFITVINPKKVLTDYELDDSAIAPVRLIGTFVVPLLIIGIYLLFRERGVEGAWIFFITAFLISAFQLCLDICQRQKIIDSNYKVVNKTSDTVVSIVFVISNIILIYGLSDKIYL